MALARGFCWESNDYKTVHHAIYTFMNTRGAVKALAVVTVSIKLHYHCNKLNKLKFVYEMGTPGNAIKEKALPTGIKYSRRETILNMKLITSYTFFSL